MTAKEIISLIDTIRPNIVSTEEKLHWIYSLEMKISRHMSRYNKVFPVVETVLETTPLLLGKEYRYMYAYYAVAMIDLGNQDIAMYNNSSSFFNDMFENWQKQWRRENVPITDKAGEA